MTKKLNIRLLFLASFVLLIINACGYGWVSQPHAGHIISLDPCTSKSDVENLGIKSIKPVGTNQLQIEIMLKSPCADIKSVGVNTLTIGVYDAGNYKIPDDLSNLDLGFGTGGAGCDANSGILSPTPADYEAKHANAIDFVSGTAVSFVVGKIHRNSIYVFSTKLPYTLTKIGIGSKCVDNIQDMNVFDPFIVDSRTNSPISSTKGEYIYQSLIGSEAGDSASAGVGLIKLGAPPFTVGTLGTNDANYVGLASKQGITSESSYYQFILHIKPSKSGQGYYFVLSTVDQPVLAITGKFSLNNEKVYNSSGIKDYKIDCHKDIASCGTPVNPN